MIVEFLTVKPYARNDARTDPWVGRKEEVP